MPSYPHGVRHGPALSFATTARGAASSVGGRAAFMAIMVTPWVCAWCGGDVVRVIVHGSLVNKRFCSRRHRGTIITRIATAWVVKVEEDDVVVVKTPLCI